MSEDEPAWMDGLRAATRLEPGDRVLIAIEHVPVEQAQRMRDQLRERFPGVEFTLVAGVRGLAVQPAGS